MLVVGQKFYLIIQIIKKHTWAQLIVRDGFKRNLIGLSILLEKYDFIAHIGHHLDDISLGEFEGFYTVIVLWLGMAPDPAICADHVCSMAYRAKIEAIILAGYYFWVAHAYCHPIRR